MESLVKMAREDEEQADSLISCEAKSPTVMNLPLLAGFCLNLNF